MTHPDWIAVDWGTSRLRAWAMAGAAPLAEAESAAGMGGLAPEDYEPTLLALIGDWLGPARIPVLICGMAGARQGWAEAGYRATPCPAAAPPGGLTQAPAADPRLDVRILAGVSQAEPPDVMRGEETQIAGFLAANPDFDGALCLPGTHSKWAHVSAGEIVSFRSFMTGELFALLSDHSVLRHSVGPGWDAAAFTAALDDAMAKPEATATRLFAIRAASLLGPADPAAARARLSGLLIGLELAASRPYWLGRAVAVIGATPLARIYGAALDSQGLAPKIAVGGVMTLAGLCAARQTM